MAVDVAATLHTYARRRFLLDVVRDILDDVESEGRVRVTPAEFRQIDGIFAEVVSLGRVLYDRPAKKPEPWVPLRGPMFVPDPRGGPGCIRDM